MVVIMISSAPASHPITPPSSSSSAIRSPTTAAAAAAHSQLPSPLSRLPLPPPALDHVQPIVDSAAPAVQCQLARVRISDIAPYDGAPIGTYVRAVEALSGSLMRNNAAVIELGADDAALLRCGLEASRLYFIADHVHRRLRVVLEERVERRWLRLDWKVEFGVKTVVFGQRWAR